MRPSNLSLSLKQFLMKSKVLIFLTILTCLASCERKTKPDYPEEIVAYHLEKQYESAVYEFYKFCITADCNCSGVVYGEHGVDTISLLAADVRLKHLKIKGDSVFYVFDFVKDRKELRPANKWEGCFWLPILMFLGDDEYLVSALLDDGQINYCKREDMAYPSTDRAFTIDDSLCIVNDSLSKIDDLQFLRCIQNSSEVNPWLKDYVNSRE